MAHLHLSYYLQFPPAAAPSSDPRGSGDCGVSLNCSPWDVLILGPTPTYFSIVSCSLSCLGSLLIFLAYFTLRGIRNVAQKIITLLALADLCTAAGYLLASWNFLTNRSESCSRFDTICEVQSFITSWSSICSFGWTCALALHFYLLLRGSAKRPSLSASKLLVCQNMVIWLFPLLILLPLLVTGKLGHSSYAVSNWCFIRSPRAHRGGEASGGVDKAEVALILVGGKLWELLSYLFVIVMYTLTTLKLNKQVSYAIL